MGRIALAPQIKFNVNVKMGIVSIQLIQLNVYVLRVIILLMVTVWGAPRASIKMLLDSHPVSPHHQESM